MQSQKKSVVAAFAMVLATSVAANEPQQLWDAAKQGKIDEVRKLLDAGVPVDAKTQFGATALYFAATAGHGDVCTLLIERGADRTLRDTSYNFCPMDMAAWKGRTDAVKALLDAGETEFIGPAFAATSNGHVETVETLIKNREFPPPVLVQLWQSAKNGGHDEIMAMLERNGVTPPTAEKPAAAFEVPTATLQRYTGTYADADDASSQFVVALVDGDLMIGQTVKSASKLIPQSATQFRVDGAQSLIDFETDESGKAIAYSRRAGDDIGRRVRIADDVRDKLVLATKDAYRPVANAKPWPEFRGENRAGTADGQHPPLTWDLESSKNVAWKVSVPGLGHSSPVIYGDKIFITTAIGDPKAGITQREYGWIDAVPEQFEHVWKVLCYDLNTGRKLWEREAKRGVPRAGRHWKSSHASCSVATDGSHLVAFFGAEGLYCYDVNGNEKWQRDFGVLNGTWYIDDTFEWGFASSPIIDDGVVYVQCHVSRDSVTAALDVESGRELWRVATNEVPSWCTPLIVERDGRRQLVEVGTNGVRGYDMKNGDELWRVKNMSHITVASPVLGEDYIFATGGYQPVRPIYAIKPDATGTVDMADAKPQNDLCAWSELKGGVYQATPLAYGGRLYLLAGNGILSCYEQKSGKQLYKTRIAGGRGGEYTASPIAADGNVFFASERGEIFVVAAGDEYKLIAANTVDAPCMATPAISDGKLVVRTLDSLIAFTHDKAKK